MPKKKSKSSFKDMMNEARTGKTSDKSSGDDQRFPKKAKKKKK